MALFIFGLLAFLSTGVRGSPTGPNHSLQNSTYTNPVLPGWHSDPSCTYVEEPYDAFFCTTSSFLAFPGMPVYVTKDLMNWRLASNAIYTPSQCPYIGNSTVQLAGTYASTIRYREGVFYLITVYVPVVTSGYTGLIYTTTNPFDSESWSAPVLFDPFGSGDPDLFWDDDGQAWITTAGCYTAKIDVATGQIGTATNIWNGTGLPYPEGPHIYRKDGYYYLMIAEGGSGPNHQITIARSTNITGPYDPYKNNPILTNANTTQYIQTVGHGDLFQDTSGNWWGVALGTRSGPAYTHYPMGREMMLYPVRWDEGEWPVLQPVRDVMEGWPLPQLTRDVDGSGPFIEDSEFLDFAPGTSLPAYLEYWGFPDPESFVVSPKSHEYTLRITPSVHGLTTPNITDPLYPLSFISRRQTDTKFTFSADISFEPTEVGDEAGVTLFLNQLQHVDLSITKTNSSVELRLAKTTLFSSNDNETYPIITSPIPSSWKNDPITMEIRAVDDGWFEFYASSATGKGKPLLIGGANSTIVSGGLGLFTGSLVGPYATYNGNNGTAQLYVSNWKYTPQGQSLGDGSYVPYTPYIYST